QVGDHDRLVHLRRRAGRPCVPPRVRGACSAGGHPGHPRARRALGRRRQIAVRAAGSPGVASAPDLWPREQGVGMTSSAPLTNSRELPEPTEFSIRDPLPGAGSTNLLEASAGTGKTWTIAALVARFVAEGHCTLPEMLVVTFGRAASQELRARVREQLVEAERLLHKPPATLPGDPLKALLLDCNDEERVLRLRRIRDALTSFDEATIATTHQFCQQVLRSLGVAGTSDASAHLVEDLDDLLVEVVDDLYLRGFVGDRETPVFSRADALSIARAAVDDIHAELRPDPRSGDRRSTPVRRAKFAELVRHELDVRKRRLQVMHYNDLLTQLA